jgi:lipoprotein-releasing system ATP-binding protein
MLLEVRDIFKSYTSRYGRNIRDVLQGVTISVGKGEKVAIAGPSGSGKTTLLNLIGALDFPDRGKILFDGKSLSGMTESQIAVFRNRSIGFIFQFHHLLPQLTLWENIMIPVLPGKKDITGAGERGEMLLKETGLWDIRHQKPSELSGGECQRTAVARALINNPSLILADEPTGSLDSENASVLADLLLRLNEKLECGLIVVTHSPEIASRMDKTYNLLNGVLVDEKGSGSKLNAPGEISSRE